DRLGQERPGGKIQGELARLAGHLDIVVLEAQVGVLQDDVSWPKAMAPARLQLQVVRCLGKARQDACLEGGEDDEHIAQVQRGQAAQTEEDGAASSRGERSHEDEPLACRNGEPPGANGERTRNRSEEHTSELQSRENIVCRLLLEK